METYTEEEHDYSYERYVRKIIETNGKRGIRSFYYPKINTWEVDIDYGKYNFIGKISQEGIPIEGKISNDTITISFENNNKFLNNNFKDTIIGLYQDGINKMFQEEANNNAFLYYTKNCEVIPEQAGESSSDEEEQNVIHEEPTQPIQQPQNQSNLNLQHGQSRKFGRSNSK